MTPAICLLPVAFLTPPPGYVRGEVCATCHAEIARTYAASGMARTFSRVSDLPAGGYDHALSGRRYEVTGRSVRRTEPVALEKRADFAIGSGNHARTYAHQRPDGSLVELPLTWYGYWAMSPGYDRPNHDDFRRPITDECLFCHNAYPGVGEGIDCQRCHGPGEAHVRAGGKRGILNPARLPPEGQMDVCLQCHLETTSQRLPNAIRRYGREPFSYRPGEPLSDYVLHFDHAAGREDKFEVNHAGYRLLKSRCFQGSAGRLTCTTCHDPHRPAKAGYRDACASCHATDHGTECAACHMPKRRADDAPLVWVTDHWIRRKPESREPRPPEPYTGEVVPFGHRDEPLYYAVAQLKHEANLEAGIELLRRLRPKQPEFNLELGEAYFKTGDLVQAEAHFRKALALPRARSRLGEILLRRGKPREAVETLRSAAGPEAAMARAVALGQLGLLDESIALLRQYPEHPLALLNLGVSLEQKGNFDGAAAAYREALRHQPDFAAARGHLARLER